MARGLGKLAPDLADARKGGQKPFPAGRVSGEKGEEQTVVTHHGDGTHTTQHSDGSTEEHPDHLHMLASLGHKLSGGDKHHVVQDKGDTFAQHGIYEDGEHYGSHDHENVDELKSSMGKFLDEEGQEWAGEGKDAQKPEERDEPAYGGMRG
jgi:hypothetical protein